MSCYRSMVTMLQNLTLWALTRDQCLWSWTLHCMASLTRTWTESKHFYGHAAFETQCLLLNNNCPNALASPPAFAWQHSSSAASCLRRALAQAIEQAFNQLIRYLQGQVQGDQVPLYHILPHLFPLQVFCGHLEDGRLSERGAGDSHTA